MKKSGSIRRTDPILGRSIASRESPLLFAFQDGTALPGPDAFQSGPGSFSTIGSPNVFCEVSKPVPQRTFTLYWIPPERKSHLEIIRRNYE
jgi:hypothetical protein